MTFGVACCAIEMMAAGAGRIDLDRFGAGAFRASPRQADLMIVAGTVTFKMASRIRRLYEQMPEPKYVLAMGACTIGGGPYFEYRLPRRQGRRPDRAGGRVRSGLPPRPDALVEGLLRLQDKIEGHRIAKRPVDGGGLWRSFGRQGVKVDDELPIPHHTGFVRVSEIAPPPDRRDS